MLTTIATVRVAGRQHRVHQVFLAAAQYIRPEELLPRDGFGIRAEAADDLGTHVFRVARLLRAHAVNDEYAKLGHFDISCCSDR